MKLSDNNETNTTVLNNIRNRILFNRNQNNSLFRENHSFNRRDLIQNVVFPVSLPPPPPPP